MLSAPGESVTSSYLDVIDWYVPRVVADTLIEDFLLVLLENCGGNISNALKGKNKRQTWRSRHSPGSINM